MADTTDTQPVEDQKTIVRLIARRHADGELTFVSARSRIQIMTGCNSYTAGRILDKARQHSDHPLDPGISEAYGLLIDEAVNR